MEDKETRRGFVLYYDDLDILAYADCAVFTTVISRLAELSKSLDETGEIITFERDFEDGVYQALFEAMARKVIRDHRKYREKSRTNTIIAKTAAIIREAKMKGKTISKYEASRLAEEWYEKQQGERPPNA